MVSTFKVWLPGKKQVVWLYISDEGGSIAACDYINEELEYEDEMTLSSFNLTDAIAYSMPYFGLYRYCYIEYCQRCNTESNIPFIFLTAELKKTVTPEYIKWHLRELGTMFFTDGYKLIMDDLYAEGDPEILKAKSMLRYMNKLLGDGEVTEEFDNAMISIKFGDKTITFVNSAAIFNGLQSCLNEFIDSY